MKVWIAAAVLAAGIVPASAITGEQMMNSCVGPASADRELCWGYVSGYVEGAVAATGGSAPANKCYEGTPTAIAVFHGINKLAQNRDLSGAEPSVVVDQAWRNVCEQKATSQ